MYNLFANHFHHSNRHCLNKLIFIIQCLSLIQPVSHKVFNLIDKNEYLKIEKSNKLAKYKKQINLNIVLVNINIKYNLL
jgi:hypothetical protein